MHYGGDGDGEGEGNKPLQFGSVDVSATITDKRNKALPSDGKGKERELPILPRTLSRGFSIHPSSSVMVALPLSNHSEFITGRAAAEGTEWKTQQPPTTAALRVGRSGRMG